VREEPDLPVIRDSEELSVQRTGTVLLSTDGLMPRISPDFRPVFSYPHIVKMKLACRLKLYQCCVVSTTFPIALKLLATEQCSPATVGMVMGVNMMAWTMLMLTGEIFRKFVGKIYLR